MSNPHDAIRALKAVVDNNGGSGDPVGGTLVGVSYSPEYGTYAVTVDCGETSAGAEAPTLEMALGAAARCDEGVWVLLNASGAVVCQECRGDGCAECMDGVQHPYGFETGYSPTSVAHTDERPPAAALARAYNEYGGMEQK